MQALDHADPAFAPLLGSAIVALSYSLCGVSPDAAVPAGGVVAGFDKLAPKYIATTEGRDGPGPDQRKAYSSCGDQLHRILELIGVRNEPWVNRKSLGHYTVGANIQRLEPGPCPIAKTPPRDTAYCPPAGSLCLIWTSGYDAHAFVVLGPGSDPNHILTANYGAGGMSSATAPGANVADSPWTLEKVPATTPGAPPKPTGRHLIGGSRRVLQSVITPEAIVPYISAQIDLSGVTLSAALQDGVDLIAALGARYE